MWRPDQSNLALKFCGLLQTAAKIPMYDTIRIWQSPAADHAHDAMLYSTSALRFPVFADGAYYAGAPSMITTPTCETPSTNMSR